jgi:predicted nuclease of predicted toxin-antitoxin system
MNMPKSVIDPLRARGHDVLRVDDLSLGRAMDEELAVLARRENRVVITFDLDFGQIAIGDGPPSIVILRLRSIRSPHVLARLNVALASAGAELVTGALVVADDTRVRIRPYGTDNE